MNLAQPTFIDRADDVLDAGVSLIAIRPLSSRPDKLASSRLTDALKAAIARCCAARGDDDGNRAALIIECTGLPAWEQRELLAHFREQAEMFERANRGGRP